MTADELLNQGKRALVDRLMKDAPFINLLVMPSVPEVELPSAVIPEDDAAVLINVGHDMQIPSLDLCITDKGIRGTLSFGRTPCMCHFPWDSIVAIGAYGRLFACPRTEQGVLEKESDVGPKLSLV